MHVVCLISDQLVPNYLPATSRELGITKVTMAVSERMRAKADVLRRTFRARQLEVGEDIPMGSGVDMGAMEEAFFGWLEENAESKPVLNATGGTKPMAIAALEAFRCGELPAFYVDVDTDKLTWVHSDREDVQLEDTLKLKTMLELSGYEILEAEHASHLRNRDWFKFAEETAEKKWWPELAKMNELANAVSDRGANPDCGEEASGARAFTNAETAHWAELVEALHRCGLSKRSSHVHFVSADAARFCCGGWLEHLAFQAVKGLGVKKDRALMNVQIRSGEAQNELDVAVAHRNRLFAIECKTKRMKRAAADDALYKIAEVKSLAGGLRATGILVSCRPVVKEVKDRAKDMGVAIIDDLGNLQAHLKTVIGL